MIKVDKEEKRITVYTDSYKITGKVFLPRGGRISDFLGGITEKRFIPVKEVIVTDFSGNEVCKSNFINLNTERVVYVVPDEEIE